MNTQQRTINNVIYNVVKIKCNCICHKMSGVKHVRQCCDNGWKSKLVKSK